MLTDIDIAIENSLPNDMYRGPASSLLPAPQEPEDIEGVPLLIREFQRYSKDLHTQERILDTKIALQEKHNALSRQYIETQRCMNNQKSQELDRYITSFKSAVWELNQIVSDLKANAKK
jgi:hypothetical protein